MAELGDNTGQLAVPWQTEMRGIDASADISPKWLRSRLIIIMIGVNRERRSRVARATMTNENWYAQGGVEMDKAAR